MFEQLLTTWGSEPEFNSEFELYLLRVASDVGRTFRSQTNTSHHDIMRLCERRERICLKFAKSCKRLENFKNLFSIHNSKHNMETRHGERYQICRSNGKKIWKMEYDAISLIPEMLQKLNRVCKEQIQNTKQLKKSIKKRREMTISDDYFSC